ncbi:hypothetical protein CPC08DRAFT_235693 [Agrocybe pediades]|nr:hypothetical protein CPC08DRAFT_235693 [Agrocybe pediades]
MSCYHKDTGLPTNIINLSQLDYIKSKCPIKEGACQFCQEMRTAEEDVEAAITRLKETLNRHQRLKTQINHRHSPTIRDLPVEILSKIFYSCFSAEMREGGGEPTYEDSFVPLRIGAVCKTWRQIAWASPELWTVIFMKRLYSSASHTCKQYEIMEGWIERSGALPLYVYLEEDAEPPRDKRVVPGGCNDCWELCLQLLSKCCETWEVASLDLSLRSFFHVAYEVKVKPPTRRLALHSADEDWFPATDDTNRGIKLCQDSSLAPQEISINYPIRLRHVNIDWHGMAHIHVQGWPPGECINLLRDVPHLESCSFIEVGDLSETEMLTVHGGPVIPICHKSHKYLHFQCNKSPATFFDQVTLPSLEELDYSYIFPEEALHSTYLQEFFARSHCPLKSLSLHVGQLNPTEYLITIRYLIPSLVHLTLISSSAFTWSPQESIQNHLLTHLAKTASSCRTEGADNFLPRLEALELGYLSRHSPDWSSISDVFGDPSELRRGRATTIQVCCNRHLQA